MYMIEMCVITLTLHDTAHTDDSMSIYIYISSYTSTSLCTITLPHHDIAYTDDTYMCSLQLSATPYLLPHHHHIAWQHIPPLHVLMMSPLHTIHPTAHEY